DRLHPGLRATRVEIHATEEIAVVGERDRGEFQLLGLPDQLLEPRRPVEQAVLRMHVQMDEIGVFHVIARMWMVSLTRNARRCPMDSSTAPTEVSARATRS